TRRTPHDGDRRAAACRERRSLLGAASDRLPAHYAHPRDRCAAGGRGSRSRRAHPDAPREAGSPMRRVLRLVLLVVAVIAGSKLLIENVLGLSIEGWLRAQVADGGVGAASVIVGLLVADLL